MNPIASMILTAAATSDVQFPLASYVFKPTDPGPWLKRKVGSRRAYSGVASDGVVKLPSGTRYAMRRDGWRRIKEAA